MWKKGRSTILRAVSPPINLKSRRFTIEFFLSPNYDTDANVISNGNHLLENLNMKKKYESRPNNY